MSDQKRGLGRGLSALLGDAPEPAGAPAQGDGRRMAPIELIRRNPDQPRRLFLEVEISELADSIRSKGVLQPILVRPVANAPGEFQIVAGERRWRAAQRAGLREVPIVVRDLDDAESLEIAILENVQRADLNAMGFDDERTVGILGDGEVRLAAQAHATFAGSEPHVVGV